MGENKLEGRTHRKLEFIMFFLSLGLVYGYCLWRCSPFGVEPARIERQMC